MKKQCSVHFVAEFIKKVMAGPPESKK